MAFAQQFGSLEAALANGVRLLAAEPEAAAEQAREILSQDAENRPALRLLGRALRKLGRDEEAAQAEVGAIDAASNEPALVGAAQAIQAGNLSRAEQLVRPYLDRHPDDPAALRLIAEIAARVGAFDKAISCLHRSIDLAPTYASARLRLARVLYDRQDFRGAIEQLDELIEIDPEQGKAGLFKASTLVMAGEYSEAAQLYEKLLEKVPDKSAPWIGYGHVLNTLGRFQDAVAAYRRAVSIEPAQGEGWWYLANLKTARFSQDDAGEMLATLDRPELDDKNRIQLQFALGKAFEDAGNYEQSFAHYASGNRMKVPELAYDPKAAARTVAGSEATFTADYFQDRAGAGSPSTAPIFVLGMPRAGSTLIEQILASHSMIEGTAELQHIPNLRKQLSIETGSAYPTSIAGYSAAALTRLGESYLASARANRKSDRALFTDKLPNNWMSLGLILTILPNARIVDARRHPMACGFSNFKQLYSRGQEFSYSLDWMGRYYVDYVRMMRHFDELFPGRVHRVIHEQLIDNPEEEIRRLLDYIGVPFEEACLRFHENERPVRTPSAGQVRQPLNRQWGEQWRHFEPWLDELKQALGPVLSAYPDVPDRAQLQ